MKSNESSDEAQVIEDSGLFDAAWYLSQYEDVAESGDDPLTHFEEIGWTEGRLPNFYFDPAWYIATHQLDGMDGNPLIHYIVVGERAGAPPSPHFDPQWYREVHSLDADTSPLQHYLLSRTSGLVSPLPSFDVAAYCAEHPEVVAEGRDPYEDFVTRSDQQPVEPPPGFALAPLPKYAVIESLLGVQPDFAHPQNIPWDSVMEVIRLFLDCSPVDEAWYRQVNPDVDEAIRNGELASAKEHFVNAGYFEGRSGRPDEDVHEVNEVQASLQEYVHLSDQIPGWTRGVEAEALAERAYALPDDAEIVEIGSFLGSGSVLLAGARKARGSGRVHCVDPFDGSGDDFSVPQYQAILGASSGRTQRNQFDDNVRKAGMADWIEVHQGTAEAIAETWTTPIDLLFIDGDQSPAGARSAYLAWAPWLNVGGTLALHNSEPHPDEDSHDGHFRVAQEFVKGPAYEEIEVIGSTTFARKTSWTEASGSLEDLSQFAKAWGLDLEGLTDEEIWPRYGVLPHGDSNFSGQIGALRVITLGRYGNRFYQLLNAAMIARRMGCGEIRLDGEIETLPCSIRGIRFRRASDPDLTPCAELRGVFCSYRGFDRLIEPLDAWFIRDTIEHFVAPFFTCEAPVLEENVMVLHFRAGDVFNADSGWVPSHYVMPPASFYTHAFEFARRQLGVTEARIVYEDRGNPAIAAVEHYFETRDIPFRSESGSIEEDAATLRSASHLAIPYGSFGEANALLSHRIRSLFSFRCTESHQWLYRRTESLLEVTLRRASNVRTFVTHDRGGYIPPFGWQGTAEQLALIRDYPENALDIREIS